MMQYSILLLDSLFPGVPYLQNVLNLDRLSCFIVTGQEKFYISGIVADILTKFARLTDNGLVRSKREYYHNCSL